MTESSRSASPIPVLPLETSTPSINVRHASLIAIGLFVTTFAQTSVMGKLPLQFVLKDKLGMGPEAMAAFFTLIILPWNFKPLAGVLSDGLPLFGYRRGPYLLLSGLGCALFWGLMGLVPPSYAVLALVAVVLNIFMVVGSTVSGALLVEEGQQHGATGRLSSIRVVVMYGAQLITGPISGYLASRAFGLTAATGAACCFLLVPATLLLLREPPAARRTGVWSEMWQQLKSAFSSKALWAAGGMFLFVRIAPGFSGQPILFFQTDTLHFSKQFLGYLQMFNGLGSVIGAVAYALVCRYWPLRRLLTWGIIINVASTVIYFAYRTPPSAILIETLAGLGLAAAELPLFDLCARATPKGSEALGYALMMALSNVGLSLSDLSGSWLFEKYHLTFMNLVWINAGTTGITLLAVPFLPAAFMEPREGEQSA